MDVKKVLAIDVIVGKMAKMHFIEGHLSGMGDTIVSGKEGEEDYGEQHWQAPFGPLWRLGLRKWFVLVEHVVSQRWFVLEFLELKENGAIEPWSIRVAIKISNGEGVQRTSEASLCLLSIFSFGDSGDGDLLGSAAAAARSAETFFVLLVRADIRRGFGFGFDLGRKRVDASPTTAT